MALKHIRRLNLFALDLGNCQIITDKGLESLRSLCNLEALRLRQCSRITARGLENLKELRHLKYLDLRGSEKIKGADLENLIGCVDLEYLDMSYCDVTDQDLKTLTGFINLRRLVLRGCTKLTYQGFLSVARH